MSRSGRGEFSEDHFPELEGMRARARQRRSLTRIAMIALSFAGGLVLAGFAYLAILLVSAGAHLALGQAQAYAENGAWSPR